MNIRILVLLFALFVFSQSKVLKLSCKQIREFVDGHNLRRQLLAKGIVPNQPPAAEMKYMVWDDELAAKASNWAATNQFAHNPNRNIDSGRFPTGENIFWSYSTDPNFQFDITSALDSWFNEHKDFNYRPISASDFSGGSKKMVGHYTQMAWSDSTFVGCGISEELKNGNKHVYVVCNYGPAGNYIGQTPYKSGSEGSGKLVCGKYDCSRPYGSCNKE